MSFLLDAENSSVTENLENLPVVEDSTHGSAPVRRVYLLSFGGFCCLQVASLIVLSDWDPFIVCGQRLWRGGFSFIAFVYSYGWYREWHFSPVMLAVNAVVCVGLPTIFLALHRQATKQPIHFSLRTALAATAVIASVLALALFFDDLSREAMNEWWWHLPVTY